MLAALLHERDRDTAAARPQPVRKELRASLDGKEAACGKLAERAALRDSRQNTDRVALTDRAEPLQAQMLSHLPTYTLVLDIIHASEYLWESANAVGGKPMQRAPPGFGSIWSCCWRDDGRRDCGIGTGYLRTQRDGDANAGAAQDDWLLPAESPLYAL